MGGVDLAGRGGKRCGEAIILVHLTCEHALKEPGRYGGRRCGEAIIPVHMTWE